MKYLVTGASGFIGRAVCERLSDAGDVELVATSRSSDHAGAAFGSVTPRELAPDTSWHDLLESVDVVVHTAARVHVSSGPDSLVEYRRVNVDGTASLASQAAECGVRRFVFLSSVKVNGDCTQPGHAFRADDPPAPADAYATSKHEAELALSRLTKAKNMEVVVIRPPLVYGPGVKANFLSLMRWVHRGYPLPFTSVKNLRSLVALDNLIDSIRICCVHPRAANEVFMVSDGEDVSTAELVIRLGTALNRPAHMLPVPHNLLSGLATAVGKRTQAMSLLGSLQVDTRKTRELLNWKPTISMDEALKATARLFLEGLR